MSLDSWNKGVQILTSSTLPVYLYDGTKRCVCLQLSEPFKSAVLKAIKECQAKLNVANSSLDEPNTNTANSNEMGTSPESFATAETPPSSPLGQLTSPINSDGTEATLLPLMPLTGQWSVGNSGFPVELPQT